MAEKKKKKNPQDEDDSTLLLDKLYDKKCKLNSVPKTKLLNEDADDVEALTLFDPIGPVGVRSLMEALTEIKLWGCGGGDEGARTICIYMKKAQTIEYLSLMKEGIGILGQALHPAANVPLIKLKLDQNDLGSQGLKRLSEGLAMNNTLQKLSLCNCNIDSEGSKYFQEILSNVETKLEKLKIAQNQLGNEGIYQLFRALEVNDVLQNLNIQDNQLNLIKYKINDEKDQDNIEFIEANKVIQKTYDIIAKVMKENTSLIQYNYRYNILGDEMGQKIIECIEQNKNLYRIELPDKMLLAIIEKVKNLTKKRKPKKKGKGKKGKNKK